MTQEGLDRRRFLTQCGLGVGAVALGSVVPHPALAQSALATHPPSPPPDGTANLSAVEGPTVSIPQASPRTLVAPSVTQPSPALSQVISSGSGSRTHAARIAHLTDSHCTTAWNATPNVINQVAACFDLVNAIGDPPVDLILHGGDIINDALAVSQASALAQVGYWGAASAGNTIPMRFACGNHDIWAWGLAGADTSDPLYGKLFFESQFGEQRYYSFDQAGWHIIVLDSDSPKLPASGFPYSGKLDSTQFAWLQADLNATPNEMPVLILSHFPIMSAALYRIGWVTPFVPGDASLHTKDNAVHMDVVQLVQLFAQHPNVKLCLSGHIHLFDHLECYGVHYICSGAVCGRWWLSPNIYFGTPAGFGVVDLYTDGTFDYRYVAASGFNYEWIGSTLPSLPASLSVFMAD